MTLLKIANGTVYDPINGVNGAVMDVWIQDGKVVAPPADAHADRVLDAAGLVVMPGGVDMHSHIAGPKVNLGRKLRPEDRRQGPPRPPHAAHPLEGFVGKARPAPLPPATFTPASVTPRPSMPPFPRSAVSATHTKSSMIRPSSTKGFFLLFGNSFITSCGQIADREPEKLRAPSSAGCSAPPRSTAVKLVNPGGVEQWKASKGNIHDLDTPVEHFGVTARQIITELAQTAMDLGLPHSVHIHCNNLGLPGNWKTTLATMEALEGRRAHLTHVQFHSYGGEPDDQAAFCSQVPALADYVNSHPNLTVDVGQVLFGDTTSMTGDGPLGYYLHKVTGRKWANCDTEMEAGCGIVPISYKEKSFVHALQWAIGLEWYLLIKDPWRIAMSTDHPNGGSFLAYPEIIQLLMDRTYRREVLERVHPRVLRRSTLKDLDREYSLYEIAIITRAAPARMLGLPHKVVLESGPTRTSPSTRPARTRRRCSRCRALGRPRAACFRRGAGGYSRAEVFGKDPARGAGV